MLLLLLPSGLVLAVYGLTSGPTDATTRQCQQPPETGICAAYFLKWHYDAQNGTCAEFLYGGCLGNDNRFDTEEECMRTCGSVLLPEPIIQSPFSDPSFNISTAENGTNILI